MTGWIHHIDVTVSDVTAAARFFDAIFPLIGFHRGPDCADGPIWAGAQLELGLQRARSLRPHDRHSPGLHHLAFGAPDRGSVDAFHRELVSRGVEILDPPSEYPEYAPGYYAVFFTGPDGIKLEYVFTPRWPSNVDPRYRIALARPRDLPALAAIERTAAQLLRGVAPQSVLDETTSEADLREPQAAGRLWVALAGDAPVGFALVEMLAADLPHLEEIDVHPDHGRRGVGTALLREVCDWVERSGYAEITLTTFRAVPWNMPFYRRLGFEEVPAGDLRPELAVVVADEAARGLETQRRAVMSYRPGAGRSHLR